MRVIEGKIIQALRGWYGEGLKNLSCRDSVMVEGKTRKYYLWNSLLFWNDSENVYYFSGRGWNSSTTRNRLNRILGSFFNAGICQEKWGWYLSWHGNKYPVDPESIYCFRGNKLYRLGAQEEEVKLL